MANFSDSQTLVLWALAWRTGRPVAIPEIRQDLVDRGLGLTADVIYSAVRKLQRAGLVHCPGRRKYAAGEAPPHGIRRRRAYVAAWVYELTALGRAEAASRREALEKFMTVPPRRPIPPRLVIPAPAPDVGIGLNYRPVP